MNIEARGVTGYECIDSPYDQSEIEYLVEAYEATGEVRLDQSREFEEEQINVVMICLLTCCRSYHLSCCCFEKALQTGTHGFCIDLLHESQLLQLPP